MWYSVISFSNVSFSGSITLVGEEMIFLLSITRKLCGFCSERFPLPLGAQDRLHYFPGPFIKLPIHCLITFLIVFPNFITVATVSGDVFVP